MSLDLSLKETQKEWRGTLKSYVIGFFSCIALTILAFFFVSERLLADHLLIIFIVVLALVQAVIQLRFFLHLGQEEKPRWETLIFLFMAGVLLIIVAGTLWIMFDLHMRMMSEMPMEMTHD